MNTKGIKFLSVLAVIALAFAVVAVVTSADENDATGDLSPKYVPKVHGPLDFAADLDVATGYSNAILGNNIVVTYEEQNGTEYKGIYKITGSLGKQKIGADTQVKAFYDLWTTNSKCNYGIAFGYEAQADGEKVKINNSTGNPLKEGDVEDGLFYISKTGTFTVTIVDGEHDYVYLVDYSAVKLDTTDSTSTPADPKGFVGLNGYNPWVDINVDEPYHWAEGKYPSNSTLNNSVTITEVEPSSSDLYAEYTINAKLAETDFSAGGNMDYSGTEYKYALIYQIEGLAAYDNYLGCTPVTGTGWNTGDSKTWYHAVASESGHTEETFAIYFKSVPTTAGTAYIYFGPTDMASQNDVANAQKIKINFNFSGISKDSITNDASKIKEKLEAAAATANKTVELIATADVASFPADTKVADDQTLVLKTTGDFTITGDLKVGSGSDVKAIKLDAVTGTIEISKGSIIINAVEWTGGEVKVNKGDVVKIYGTGAGDLAISINGFTTGDKASVIVEKGKDLTLTAGSFTLKDGVSLTVDGTLTTPTLATKAAVTINGGLAVNAFDCDGALTVDGTIVGLNPMLFYRAAIDIAEDAIVTINSTADVNFAVFSDYTKVTGKDAASGKWTYNADDDVLTLDNYNGKYNFAALPIDKILINGSNKVTYVVDKDALLPFLTLFDIESIEPVSTTGTLDIVADYSAIDGADLSSAHKVLDMDAVATNLDQVVVSVTLKGSNNAWTADQKKAADFQAVSGQVILNNSELTATIEPTFGSAKVFAVKADTITLTTSDLTVSSGDFAVSSTDVTVRNYSEFMVTGDLKATATFKVSNSSAVIVDGKAKITGFENKTESSVVLKNAVIAGTNAAVLAITGESYVYGFANSGAMTNSGSMLVRGAFTNSGTLDNLGSIAVPNAIAKAIEADGTNLTLGFPAGTTKVSLGSTSVMVGKIENIKIGTIDDKGAMKVVSATVTFAKNEDDIAAPSAGSTTYTDGTFTPLMNGQGYTLVLKNEASSITISYDKTKYTTDGDVIGKNYSITATGTNGTGADKKNIVAVPAGYTVTAGAIFTNGLTPSGASFTTAATGTVTSTGSVSINVVETLVEGDTSAKGTFNGDVSATQKVTIAGKINGNITSTAAVSVTGEMTGDIAAAGAVDVKKMTGNINTDSTVEVNGKMVGNIVSKDSVTINGGDLTGNIDITLKQAVNKFVKSQSKGIMDGVVTTTCEYKATKGSDVKTTEINKITIKGKANYQLNLIAAVDSPNESTDGTPGYLAFEAAPVVAKDDVVAFTLTAGTMKVAASLDVQTGTTIDIENGTTFEVVTGQYIDVKKGALMTASGATVKMNLETDPVPEYGVVKFEMNFTTADGYTIYSDVASALEYCDENSTLTVGTSTEIDKNVEVKKGVTIVVGNGITLTFTGKDVKMLEGASFQLAGTGTLIFNTTSQKANSDDTITYYYVNAAICFDELNNIIVLEDVRFAADGNTFTGVAATTTEPTKLSATMNYNVGTATITDGYVVSTGITLGQVKLGDNKYAATLVIEDLATLETSVLNNAAKLVKMDGTKVKEVKQLAATVTIEGTLKMNDDLTINGTFDGEGFIVLADTKKVTIVKDGAEADDRAVDAIATVSIIDKNDIFSGYTLEGVKAAKATAAVVAADIVITSTGTANKVTVAGTYKAGTIEAIGPAFLSNLVVDKGATFVTDSFTVVENSSTYGALMSESAPTVKEGKTFGYDTTYVDGDYTVYTVLANVDLTKIHEVTIEKEDFVLPETISGDAVISIKEGVVATVPAGGKTIIGTPGTSLGGAIIFSGKISIPANSYLIVYTDVLIDEDNILSADGTTKAISSVFDIEGITYATVYGSKTAATTVNLNAPAADLKPQIEGYTFTSWSAYNSKALVDNLIGDTNVTGVVVAKAFAITVMSVDGVDYYLDGVLFTLTDMEYKAYAGQIFTAKINDTLRYSGTPLIDGEEKYIVTGDDIIIATGVESNAVKITVQSAAGVNYYLDGVEFAKTDSPQTVYKGQIFTMKISDTTKYEGTPVIDGKTYYEVTQDGKTIKATGVTEKVTSVSGISLTDILLIVLVVLIAIMVVIIVLRLNRS